ncbi:hypothetical protein SJAG_02801 [Schizosaccharomyces japonicus yFS275]|uniref:Uncharacterized protein n=1 Tax=Schizosaccharomyces japonicus (strain yFS275 / FY16936) TaxID=402676 RepID=B6K178_SCHJY|nr:hypothetical protein SJAG_02801 [Schizosaccharomyces japonicus yFS275]EEB07699.2 hypothetical protein SJAG_02801 [Schizosaccharomyces japonicus yFS275]
MSVIKFKRGRQTVFVYLDEKKPSFELAIEQLRTALVLKPEQNIRLAVKDAADGEWKPLDALDDDTTLEASEYAFALDEEEPFLVEIPQVYEDEEEEAEVEPAPEETVPPNEEN